MRLTDTLFQRPNIPAQSLMLLQLAFLMAAASALPAWMKDPHSVNDDLRVVSLASDPDGTLRASFSAPGGIFSFSADINKEVTQVVWTVVDQPRLPEGLTVTAPGTEEEVDLKTADGVKVEATGGNVVITFTGEKALKLLHGGGRFRYINEYR